MNWEISVGLYPGFLIGFRNYVTEEVNKKTNKSFIKSTDTVYLPFIYMSLIIYSS